KKKNINVTLEVDISAYDDKALKEKLNNIFSMYNDNIVLNATGGTKLMAFTAYDFFSKNNKPVFYCNTEHKKIVHLLPERKTEDINANLTIEDYLASYGYRIKEEKEPLFKDLFELLIDNNLLDEFIKFCRKIRENFQQTYNRTFSSLEKHFLFQKTAAGYFLFIQINNNKQRFEFNDSKFFFGDWLEYYAYWKYKAVKENQVKIGVCISSSSGTDNEIDIMLLKDYRLKLISCKSGKIKKKQKDSGKDPKPFLYEVETLRSISAGTFGEGILILNEKPFEAVINRAKELKIK